MKATKDKKNENMDCETNPVSGQLFETSIADLDTLYPGTLDPGTVDFQAGATPSASRDGAYGATFAVAGRRLRRRLRRRCRLRRLPALRAGWCLRHHSSGASCRAAASSSY